MARQYLDKDYTDGIRKDLKIFLLSHDDTMANISLGIGIARGVLNDFLKGNRVTQPRTIARIYCYLVANGGIKK